MGGLFAVAGPGGVDRLREMLDGVGLSPGRGGRSSVVLPGCGIGIAARGGEASIGRVGSLLVGFHGFVGNWAEGAFGADVLEGLGDAERLARAIREHGPSVFETLRGEFACVAYDESDGSILAARDYFGCRPLVVRRVRDHVLLASEARALRLAGEAGPDPDMEAIRRFLDDDCQDQDTPFVGYRRIPAGRCLRFGGRGGWRETQAARWGVPDADPEAGSLPGREAASLLRRSLERAVRRSLPSDPPATTLSGGLDSSTVTALAQEEGRRGARPTALVAVSLRFPGLSCDEGPFSRSVADHLRLERHEREVTSPVPLEALQSAADAVDSLHLPNLFLVAEMAHGVRAAGRSCALSGHGGDHWFSADLAAAFGSLPRGAWRRVAALATEAWQRGNVEPGELARILLRHLRGPRPPSGNGITHDLAEAERRLPRLDPVEQLSESLGVEMRNPLLDLDLVALASGLPLESRWRGGLDKGLLRAAMAGSLPRVVAERGDKPDAGGLIDGPWKEWMSRPGPERGFLAEHQLGGPGGPDGRRHLDGSLRMAQIRTFAVGLFGRRFCA